MSFYLIRILIGTVFLGLSSCYQMRAEDDFIGVPTTNNPSIVPNHGALSQFTAMHP